HQGDGVGQQEYHEHHAGQSGDDGEDGPHLRLHQIDENVDLQMAVAADGNGCTDHHVVDEQIPGQLLAPGV
ncbi:Major facilitator superfamily (MFS) profile domain-containing protein, partial [Dysosmobacter welbionis]